MRFKIKESKLKEKEVSIIKKPEDLLKMSYSPLVNINGHIFQASGGSANSISEYFNGNQICTMHYFVPSFKDTTVYNDLGYDSFNIVFKADLRKCILYPSSISYKYL